jgi:hypothetical protein
VRNRAGGCSLLTILAAFAIPASAERLVTRAANLSADVSRVDGRIAMDLHGSIWLLSGSGGEATLASNGLQQSSRPRWSPDGKQILFQTATAEGTSLWLLDVATLERRRISDPALNNQFASFHPQGERIVYASGRNGSDFDIWETDLPTGLSWQLTRGPGDEIEAVWSQNGRNLAYIQKTADQYEIVVRQHGKPGVPVVIAEEQLSSLSWRPDGTLLTFLRGTATEARLQMVILSEPPLVREFASGEAFFQSPVSWLDRSRHYYTADGVIRTREFADRRSVPLPFRALIPEPEARPPRIIAPRQLPVITPSPERLVIRGARLFDGIWSRYRDNMDVLVAGGKIVAVEPRQDWADTTVLDLGAITILPGFIDAWSDIADGSPEVAGLKFLAYGVTTIVSGQAPLQFDHAIWEGQETPGPRLLPAANLGDGNTPDASAAYFIAHLASSPDRQHEAANGARSWQERGVPVLADNWKSHLDNDADLLLGIDSLPRTALDDRYGQVPHTGILQQGRSVTVISGIADAATPGLTALLNSRQARELGQVATTTRRFPLPQQLADTTAVIVLGSEPNGLPAGLALHAELRALQAAGLDGERVLHAAGKRPALMLGLENQIGTITPGARADLVLVSGDPLNDVSDALNIVAVVRNGRFYSLVSLLERAANARDVE